MKFDLKKLDIFRPDLFSVIFIAISVAGSFLGEYIFRWFGLYENRIYDKSLYLSFFVPFFLILILFIWRMRYRHENYHHLLLNRKFIFNYSHALSLVSILFLIVITPFELYYLKLLYSLNSGSANFDAARVMLQNEIPIIPKFFFYSSFAVGLSLTQLILKSTYKNFRKFQITITVIQLIILILFGSKSLILIPFLACIITVNMYKKIQVTPQKLLFAASLFVVIIVGSAVYTNMRSTGVASNGILVVDAMATFMPEQRDGAFLMDQESGKHLDSDFYMDNVFALMTSMTHRKIFEILFYADVDTRIKKKFIFKDLLTYDWEGGTTRVGIIADAYVFSGAIGTTIILLSFFAGIACLLMYLYSKSKALHSNYFIVLVLVNFIWTFNSDYVIQLPFLSSIIYFYLFWSVALFVAKSIINNDDPVRL